MTVFKPNGGRALIRPEPTPEKSRGGIIYPDIVRDDPKRRYRVGVLVALGPGSSTTNHKWSGRWPTFDGQKCLPNLIGRRVLYFTWDIIPPQMLVDDVAHDVIRDSNIDAYFDDAGVLVLTGDRVLVKRIEPSKKTRGGIFIPESAREVPDEGTAIAVGTGRILARGDVDPLAVHVGDRVLFKKHKGVEIDERHVEGYGGQLIMAEEDIIAIIDDAVDSATLGRALTESDKPHEAAHG